ncbi:MULTISPECIES: hypothetical protein [Brevibacillus]|uniref:hypothetical protein n=1 Tax=Brevibacillus TaxID=55080 RepID=UPI000853590C|nr:hypothetical protein [Brevibacillus sp. AG]MDC0763019.1 hypothetical protein [Brevibacillus sp. AG]
MEMNFFELQYLIADSFYTEVCVNGRTYGQAAGICHLAFDQYIYSDTILSIVAVSLLTKLMVRHDVPLSESDREDMLRVLRLAKEMDYRPMLSEDETEYVEEYLSLVRQKYEEKRTDER